MSKAISEMNKWDKESLIFLYQLTCAINSASPTDNGDTLLYNLLKIITNHINGIGATIRLISEDGGMDLVSSYGLNEELLKDLNKTSIDGNLFIHSKQTSKIIRRSSAAELIKRKNTDMISIPIRHHHHTLGVLNLFIQAGDVDLTESMSLTLIAAGEHVGQALENNRLDEMARQKLIQQERNMIANELHDSLAQTLASLRFQVRILDETLQPTSEYMAIMGIEQVENSLDEAYTDLRELIAHCRVPIEKQGLLPSIERVVKKFRDETGIHILLQCEGEITDIPATMEMNVYRIVQEALTNIKKHAHAHIVRVLIDSDKNGNFRILIENDGEGFDKKSIQKKSGQHLGLTIMQERARHLGGKLRVESEPDEGTRVELKFQYQRENAAIETQ